MELRLISTTYEGKERITREQTIPFCDDGGREEQLINLYPQVIYQQMDGFGGAITDSAAYIYSLMNPEQKKQMLDEYFGQGTMKYRFVRIPMDIKSLSEILGHANVQTTLQMYVHPSMASKRAAMEAASMLAGIA